MSKLKIVFLGTPEIACGFLKDISAAGHDVLGVISQPDKAKGRGLKVCCPPVKGTADRLCLKTYQPSSDAELKDALERLKPDLCVVVAYGRIIKEDALRAARIGFVNVHFSLLPKYRGAAPVQWTLINGETRTGVTVFWLDSGLDTGPVCAESVVSIEPHDNAQSLFARLEVEGSGLLQGALENIARGEIVKKPQLGLPSYAPRLTLEHAWLDFSLSAKKNHDRVRGLSCGPRARFLAAACSKNIVVQVLKAELIPEPPSMFGNADCGCISAIERGKGFFIKCSGSSLFVEEVQPEGKKPQKAFDFLNGLRLKPGDALALPAPGHKS
ncbi:MAG TPA: methionyl-tRNA formyltransferase [Elusimicrobia bacterium]|nr:methionyl-tRNA formyltransferase [Elusimicrobiota bacterium]